MPTAPAAQQLSAVVFFLSYKHETDACSRCAMLCIIEAMGYFVCVTATMFAAKKLFALLVEETFNYLNTYG